MSENDLRCITDARLIEMLLRSTGCRSPERVCAALSAHFGDMAGLIGASARELRAIRGVDRDTVRFLRLVGEIAGRVIAGREARTTVRSVERAAAILAPRLRDLESEALCCLCLDRLWRPADCTLICEGSRTRTEPSSYAVYRTARSAGSRAVILAHNHPTGPVEASVEDVALTQKLAELLREAKVTLIDHIIFSGEGYVSLAESGFLVPDPMREMYLAGTAGETRTGEGR